MLRGDVVTLNLSGPAGGTGFEQAGFRPAVVVSKGDAENRNVMVTVVPFTTTIRRSTLPYTMIVEPSIKNGLRNRSVLLAFQIVSYDKRRIIDVIGILETEYMNNLEKLLRNLIDL